ncbi:hypothetical protein [Pseudobutyrivibrio sp. LB2011]|uniref:hypothetical protein n=1 Tax=Pseudobutyrivibrio sp. LB2011 TaxID=1408312 RepID=UPI0005D1C582|nr:hypothetical protein [Pseudobutyrivibrio sp. LB2011]
MAPEQLSSIKKNIFVYNIIPFDSIGIYIADSKEDALENISKDLWDDIDWESYYSNHDKRTIEALKGLGFSDELIAKRMQDKKHRPLNIYDSIKIWTWEEYQKEQGFNVSERLLEIVS